MSDRADHDRLTLVGADGVGPAEMERGLPGPHIDLALPVIRAGKLLKIDATSPW